MSEGTFLRDTIVIQEGSLGVGLTSSPSYKLHVSGNSYIDATSGSPTLLLGRYNGQTTIEAASDDGGYLIMDSSGAGTGRAALNWYSSDHVVLAAGGGNVGIGTASPNTYKLEVAGNARVTTDLFVNDQLAVKTTTLATSNNFHVSSGTTGSASKSSIALVSVADNSTFSSGFAALHVINSGNRGTKGHSSGSDLLRLEFSDGIHTLFDKNGNVGIGTASPKQILFVHPATDVNLGISNSGTALRLNALNDAATVNVPMEFTGSRFNFLTGNVGIGSTTANRQLDITGATQSWATAPAIQFTSTTVASNVRNWWVGPADTAYGNFHIFPSSTQGGNPGSTSEAGNGITIDYVGKVGLGTTGPSERLEVIGTIKQKTGAGYSNYVQQSVSEAQLTFSTYSVNQTTYPSAIIFAPNGSEAARIDNGGNVGIGTTSPGSKLSVVGTTGINVSPGASGTYGSSSAINNLISLTMPYGSSAATTPNAGARVGIVFRGATADPNPSSDNNKTAAIYGVSEDTGAGYSRKMGLALYTSSFDATASERVRIDADYGNVGIGTTNPTAKLHVNGQSYLIGANYGIYGNNDSTNYRLFDNSSGQLVYNWYGAHIWQTAGGTERMRLNFDGNLGIGTTSPERNLHVFKGESNGAASNSDSTLVLENSSNTYVQFLTPTTSESGLLFGDSDNDRGALTYNHNTDSMNFRIAANTRMFINSSGNVGIGTINPTQKLHVVGIGYFSSNLLSFGLAAQTSSNYIRESSDQIRYLSRIQGRNINHNSQFIAGNTSGYSVYNNSGGSAVGISAVYYTNDSAISTSAVPNSNGYVLKISYTSGAGSTSPGYGGFYLGTTNSEVINGDKAYKQKNRIIYRIWAKIPTGRNIAFASNAYGSNGSFTWLTTTAGNDDWYEYIAVQQIGFGGSFSSTTYFYISGGSATSFNWYVAECSLIDVDSPADILYSPGLSIGYAGGTNYNSVQAGWGGLGVINNAIIGGSVGIGTVSPAQKLNITDGGILMTDENSGQPMFQARNFATSATGTFNNTYGFEYRHASSGTQIHGALIHLNENVNSRIALTVSSSFGTVAQFTSAGYVGIGTGSPEARMQVVTTSDISGTPTSYDGKYFTVGQGGTTGGNVFISYDNTNNRGYIGALSPSVAWRNLILNPGGGNVGIGTVSPQQKLHVTGGNVLIEGGSTDSRLIGFKALPAGEQGIS